MHEAGVSREVIKNKMSLRAVHNMQIFFDNVRIPENRRLPGCQGFQSVAEVLKKCRFGIGNLAAGVGLGVYDHLIKYLAEREQFKRSLTSYQLIQDKVFRVMSLVQQSLLLVYQGQRLLDGGNSTIGQMAFVKAVTSKNIRYAQKAYKIEIYSLLSLSSALIFFYKNFRFFDFFWIFDFFREAASIARAAMGGNGIILDNYVIKAFIDMEAVYTYEGTYDINTLVTARELTGIAAFKTR